MAEQKKLAALAELAPGSAKVIETESEPIALFNVDGKVYATSNTCLHAGGPIGEGSLAGNDITCPWHGWTYDVTSGQCKTNPAAKVKTYPVEIRDGDIYVNL